MQRILLLAAVFSATAGCGRDERTGQSREPASQVELEALPKAIEEAEGSWRYDAALPAARYGTSIERPEFSVVCNIGAREIHFVRSGQIAEDARAEMLIEFAGRQIKLPARPETEFYAASDPLPAAHDLVTAFMDASGVYEVTVSELPAIEAPADDTVRRVIEACRR